MISVTTTVRLHHLSPDCAWFILQPVLKELMLTPEYPEDN
jgi:hypothetical protein